MRGRLASVVSGATLFLLCGLAQPLLAAPVLSINSNTLTDYRGGTTAVQKVKPLYQQRGSDLEGGARMSGAQGPALVAPSSGYSAGMLGGIDLATLALGQGDVDMALPSDGPSVIIGRTFNQRQGSGTAVTPSNGPQGFNWFQSAMPEISLYSAGKTPSADDVIYVVLGAGKFLEYKRTGTGSTVFSGVNGASGVVKEIAGSGGTYDTYELTDAAGTVWTFWGASASHTADWQLWKKTDAAGRTAYVGSKSTQSTAVADYNIDGTPKEIFQEYGTGSDERRYTFTYGTYGGYTRLSQVKAETKTGGTWASPTGLTEVGRVSYDYYTAWTYTTGASTDTHGNAGDLKTVKIRTPLSDSGTDLNSGVFDERAKYYRYYNSYANNDGERGHIHTIKLIVGFEGCRRFDWTDSYFDDDFANAADANSATGYLTPYADAYFEYESATGTQRLSSVFFNGECGCSGGSGSGIYTFTPSANGSYTNSSGYTTTWCTRTVVAQPDGSYQTRYFDEVGQPLSSVVSNINPATGGALYWVTGIDRDSSGRVTTVHSPANNTGYTHSSGALTYSTSTGLVTFLDRYPISETSPDGSGELDGLLSGSGYQPGTSGAKVYTSHSVLSKRSLTVGAATVVRPLVTESRSYFAETPTYDVGTPANYYDATTYSYAWWNTGTNTDPQYLVSHSGLATRDDYVPSVTKTYGYRYTYDAWGRLVAAASQSSGTTVAQYRYNGLGHRIGWKAQFNSGLTYANNLWRYFQYNERWQQVGMYVESSAGSNTVGANAIESYLYHTAGLNGRGGSSYIDKIVFRDRDANGGATGDGTREERYYYLQNWRGDVVGLINTIGEVIERYRYDAYGRPESYSPADITGSGGGGAGPDGKVTSADFTAFNTAYNSGSGPVSWITDVGSTGAVASPDNTVNANDAAVYTTLYFAGTTGGIGLISGVGIDNRKGLGGYEFDPILAGSGKIDGDGVPLYHVRNRVLNSYNGKWAQKDPLGYHDSMDLYEYCKSDAIERLDGLGLCSKRQACKQNATARNADGTPWYPDAFPSEAIPIWKVPFYIRDPNYKWSTSECCNSQAGNPNIVDLLMFTICCNGEPISCYNSRFPTNDVILSCAMRHEGYHAERCNCRPGNGPSSCNSTEQPDQEECISLHTELGCLAETCGWDGKDPCFKCSACNGDLACERAVRDRVRVVITNGILHCGPNGLINRTDFPMVDKIGINCP